jgi:hypothetical protein
MKKASTPEEVTSPRKANCSTSTAAQEKRTLEALMEASANTIELRHLHNVMQPAARVKSLREQGHIIHTIRETALDLEGRAHRGVARYVLIALVGGGQ